MGSYDDPQPLPDIEHNPAAAPPADETPIDRNEPARDDVTALRIVDTVVESNTKLIANKAAWACYKKLGFHMEPYPHGDPHLDNCVFMVADRNDV